MPCLTRGLGRFSSQSWYFRCYLIPIRKKMMPNSLDSRRKLRMALLEQVGFQNRFLRYPYYSVYHAAIQNRDKALLWYSESSRVGWGRGTLQNCSLSPDRNKKTLTTVKEFILILQILNLSQEPTHSSWNPLLLQRQFICSQLSGSISFFRTRFFVILQLLGNFLRDFVGRICFLFPIIHINSIFSLSQICPLIRLMQLQSLRFEILIGFTEGNIRTSPFPISYVHFCLGLT